MRESDLSISWLNFKNPFRIDHFIFSFVDPVHPSQMKSVFSFLRKLFLQVLFKSKPMKFTLKQYSSPLCNILVLCVKWMKRCNAFIWGWFWHTTELPIVTCYISTTLVSSYFPQLDGFLHTDSIVLYLKIQMTNIENLRKIHHFSKYLTSY